MRMLHCPLRSCFSASSRFEGGKRRSSSVVAALSWIRRIVDRFRISGGNRRDFPVVKKRFVSDEAKERITENDCKQYVYDYQVRQPNFAHSQNIRRRFLSGGKKSGAGPALTYANARPDSFCLTVSVGDDCGSRHPPKTRGTMFFFTHCVNSYGSRNSCVSPDRLTTILPREYQLVLTTWNVPPIFMIRFAASS